MSSHADTIRLVFDWPMAYHSVGELADAKQALDALLAEIEEWRVLGARQLEEFTVTTQKYRAENQRLREMLEWLHRISQTDSNPYVHQKIGEALAGDAE